jgi:hypothetical protein
MSSSPTIVLSAISHGQVYPPYDGSSATWSSDKFKGNGYYGYTDGLHTVSYKTSGFVGVLQFQATLSTSPTENDWFIIPNTSVGDGVTPTNGTFYFNFNGNFVWCRAYVTNFSAGNIDRVLYNT